MPDDKKKRYAIRIAPCSSYDVGRMESWLEHMAQKGYILDKMIAGIAVFVWEEPQKLRYRMCELPQDTLYEDKAPSSEQELIAICEASGWRFVAERGVFGIFATADDTAPELQTEPWIDYDKAILQTCYVLALFSLMEISQWFFDSNWGSWLALLMTVPLFYWEKKYKAPRSFIGIIIAFLIPICFFPLTIPRNGVLITTFYEGSTDFLLSHLSFLFFFFLFFYVLAGRLKYCLCMWRGIPIDHKKIGVEKRRCTG